MPKNRDYTGLVRTPSSMAWLIAQRSKIKGQIDRLAALHAEIPQRIEVLQAELAALDAVIPLHEVKVDPVAIKGRRPRAARISGWGKLTRFLLNRLRESGNQVMYTSELAIEFARAHDIDLQTIPIPALMDRVGKRLRALAAQGHVRRHHNQATRELGRWSSMAFDLDEAA